MTDTTNAGGAWLAPLRRLDLGVLGRRSRQVLLLSAVTGAVTGLLVAAFEYLVQEQGLGHVESWPLAAQAASPAVGLVLAALALRRVAHGASPETTDAYIRNFHDRHHRLDRRPAPGRLLASAATLASGGAMGFEGPSIYTGAAVGAALQARLSRSFSREDAKLLMTAGAAAGLAAIFKAPATGAVFAIEVPYQDDLAGRMVLPALCASGVGYATFVLLRSTAPLLPVAGGARFDLVDLATAAAIGLAAGAGARLFAWALRGTKRLARRRAARARIAVAGALLAGLAVASDLVAGRPLTIGPGYRVVEWALDPHRGLYAVGALLLLRAAATLVTVGGGGAGGLFIPLVVEGALVGRLFSGWLGASGTLYPLLGIAAFLAAGYRVPLAAVMFVAETTGHPGSVVPALVAAVVAQLVMGRSSVAPDQLPARGGHLEKRLSLPVTAALATDAPAAPPTTTVARFITDFVVGRHAFTVPVVEDGRLLGVVDVADAERVAPGARDRTTVAAVMRCDHPVAHLSSTLRVAVATMEQADVDVLPVVEGERYRGLLSMDAILALDDVLTEDDEYGTAGP